MLAPDAALCLVHPLVSSPGCCWAGLGWAGLGWGRVTLKPTLQPSSSYCLGPESSCSLDTRHRGSVAVGDGPSVCGSPCAGAPSPVQTLDIDCAMH